MPEPDTRAEARRYVDGIIDVQRRHGHSPSMTPEQYEGAVTEAMQAFDRLNTAASRLAQRRKTTEEPTD